MRLDRISLRTAAILIGLGGTSALLYRAGLGANGVADIGWFIKLALVQSGIYLVAVWLVLHSRPSRSMFMLVVAFAAVFRLGIVFAPPYLSDDIYRYVWDGRVQAAGINPYRYVPSAPELAHLRDEHIYPKINRRDYAHTIYPPLAESTFLVATRISDSVVWMKLTMLGFELVGMWAMVQLLASYGLAQQRLLIYAWHPLVVWEFAGSGHVDAIAIAFIALAFLAWRKNKGSGAGLALASATLIKLFPIVLLPAFLKRTTLEFRTPRWFVLAFVAMIIVAYVPYLSVGPKAVLGFLPGYASEQGLVSGEQFYILGLARRFFGEGVPSFIFVILAMLVMSAMAGWMILRRTQSENNLRSAIVLATTTTVLFAPHYSWYFVWLVPFLCFMPSIAVFYLTIASFLLYLTWLGDSREQMFIINSLIYLPFLLIGVVEFWWRNRRFNFVLQRKIETELQT
jgi:alpha-1,6-mannosyltransferase